MIQKPFTAPDTKRYNSAWDGTTDNERLDRGMVPSGDFKPIAPARRFLFLEKEYRKQVETQEAAAAKKKQEDEKKRKNDEKKRERAAARKERAERKKEREKNEKAAKKQRRRDRRRRLDGQLVEGGGAAVTQFSSRHNTPRRRPSRRQGQIIADQRGRVRALDRARARQSHILALKQGPHDIDDYKKWRAQQDKRNEKKRGWRLEKHGRLS